MANAGRPYILAETTWREIENAAYDVVILPWGATEAHNYHLPYATDTLQTAHVAAEAARLAWERGARVIVLPAIPFGVQSGQLDIAFCMHMRPSTQAALLSDVARTLAGHGVRKLVLLNGHGGNEFRAMVRELQPQLDVFLCVVNWYSCVDAGRYFDAPGDHAGELETSVMLHVEPGLVRPLEEAGPGRERRFRISGLREGWAWAPRVWRLVSADTGVGDPRRATAERGARFFADVTERIAGLLVELAAADGVPDLYE